MQCVPTMATDRLVSSITGWCLFWNTVKQKVFSVSFPKSKITPETKNKKIPSEFSPHWNLVWLPLKIVDARRELPLPVNKSALPSGWPLIIIIIKRISRTPICCTRWEHRALCNNINNTHSPHPPPPHTPLSAAHLSILPTFRTPAM